MGRGSIFHRAKIQELVAKNATPSYGLTIIFGHPLPEVLTEHIRTLRAELETLLPGRICWYEDHHLHITIYAPKRGRYSPIPDNLQGSHLHAPLALTRQELPPNFYDIVGLVSRIEPFEVKFHTLSLDQRGVIALIGSPSREEPVLQLKGVADAIEGDVPGEERKLDAPKHLTPDLHSAFGYFRYLEPLTPEEEEIFTAKAQLQMVETNGKSYLQRAIGLPTVEVREVKLVHYSDRLLKNIVGTVVLKLGSRNEISEEEFYQCLKIS